MFPYALLRKNRDQGLAFRSGVLRFPQGLAEQKIMYFRNTHPKPETSTAIFPVAKSHRPDVACPLVFRAIQASVGRKSALVPKP